MQSLADKKIKSIYAMFKGEPGTRKSTAALSFPLPQYWQDIDGKIGAMLLPAQKWGIDTKLIDVDSFSELDPRLRRNAQIKKLEELVLNCKYKTVILDSVTSESDLINFGILKEKSGTTNKQGEEKGMRVGGIEVNTIDDYKAESSAFTEIIALTKRIQERHNCNIILIAHVVGERKIEKDSLSQAARIIITGGRTISGKIPAYCEETYHFVAERPANPDGAPEFSLYTQHTGLDFARTALPLPQKIKFNDQPLWSTYIEPAIKKLNEGIK